MSDLEPCICEGRGSAFCPRHDPRLAQPATKHRHDFDRWGYCGCGKTRAQVKGEKTRALHERGEK